MNSDEKDTTKKVKSLTYTISLENDIKEIAMREQRSVNAQIVFILEQFVMEWRGWPVEMMEKTSKEKGT